MIIESGIIVFLGLLLLFLKLSWQWRLRLLGKPLGLDLTVAVVAYFLHWGTFTGVMAAAVAGLMCSGATSIGRKIVGYTSGEATDKQGHTGIAVRPNLYYFPGMMDVGDKLAKELNHA